MPSKSHTPSKASCKGFSNKIDAPGEGNQESCQYTEEEIDFEPETFAFYMRGGAGVLCLRRVELGVLAI